MVKSAKAKITIPRESPDWEGSQPNLPDALDDTLPGDRDIRGRGVVVTRVRDSLEGYKIVRRNPFGFWYILSLENELGTFTGLKEAEEGLMKYLRDKKQKEDA